MTSLFIIHCYAPTSMSSDKIKTTFYNNLEEVIKNVKKKYIIIILMGDLNAKVCTHNGGFVKIRRKHGLEEMSDNG